MFQLSGFEGIIQKSVCIYIYTDTYLDRCWSVQKPGAPVDPNKIDPLPQAQLTHSKGPSEPFDSLWPRGPG